MRLPRELLLYLLAFCASERAYVQANTEIVNFGVAPGPDVLLPQASNWERLSPQNSERLFTVQPAPLDTAITHVCEPVTQSSLTDGACPHELWLSLGTDDPAWATYPKFTLRVSWPASSPADFYVDIYSPESLAELVYGQEVAKDRAQATAETRRTYARIRVVNTGVLTPSRSRSDNFTLGPISFIAIVEPLYLGVIPASILPTLFLIVSVATIAGVFVVPWVTKHLSAIAQDIREETSAQGDRKSR